ncbi:SPRY-domain-containing protein, partial [Basidiobolus meristosporus CBS 931.73]
MEKHPYMSVVISENTEMTFLEGDCCVQSNLPFPQWAEVSYFEVKIYEMSTDTKVAIGAASKPYPSWRFPGSLNKHSVGYFSTGHTFCNDSFEGKPYGALYGVGDVIGCGYRAQSGSIFFTRNGERFKPAVNGFYYGIYPSIAANGPCTLQVNFGQLGFVFVEANVKKWGFGPKLETVPPPAYGITENSQVLESESDYNEEELSFLQIPRRYRSIGQNSTSRTVSRNSLSF